MFTGDRRHYLIRFGIGAILGITAGLVVLFAGDAHIQALAVSDPQHNYVLYPSQLYVDNNPDWGIGIVWWSASGLAIGLMAGLATLRMKQSGTMRFALSIAAWTAILMVAFLTWRKFNAYPQDLNLINYLETFAADLAFYAWLAAFPEIFGVIVIMMIAPFFDKRASGLDIMPDELRVKYLEREAERRKSTFYRLTHPFDRRAS